MIEITGSDAARRTCDQGIGGGFEGLVGSDGVACAEFHDMDQTSGGSTGRRVTS